MVIHAEKLIVQNGQKQKTSGFLNDFISQTFASLIAVVENSCLT
jgi:hypothetical protein